MIPVAKIGIPAICGKWKKNIIRFTLQIFVRKANYGGHAHWPVTCD